MIIVTVRLDDCKGEIIVDPPEKEKSITGNHRLGKITYKLIHPPMPSTLKTDTVNGISYIQSSGRY